MKKGFFALKITGTGTRDVVAARAAPGGGLGCSHEPSTALKPRTGTPHPLQEGQTPGTLRAEGQPPRTPKPCGILTSFGMVSSWEVVWAEASKPARRQRGGPGEGGGSQGVQHPKCCQVQAAWEGSEQAGRAQQAGRLLRTPLLPTLASLLPLLFVHPGVLPSLSPPRVDSPSGWDNPGAGGCTGGLQPGTRLHSHSRSGFQRLRYPSSSPQPRRAVLRRRVLGGCSHPTQG